MEPYVSRLLWLTHYVRDGLTFRQVEVIVSLDAATVCVRWHGVPYSTWVELCQTELQLAWALFEYVVDDELIDGAVVGLFNSSYRSPYGSLQRALAAVEGYPLGLEMLVGGSAVEVELSRILRVLAAELHRLVHVLALSHVTATDIESLLGRECILLAINDDPAVAGAAVDNAELTVVHEIFLLDGVIDVEAELPEVLQLQGFVHRHCTAEDEAVVVRVGEEDRVGLHNFFHDKALAQQRSIVFLHVLRMAGGLELHMLIAYIAVSFLGVGSTERKTECCNSKYFFHIY